MQHALISELEQYDPEKFVGVNVFSGERTKVRLVLLLPGQSIPGHRRDGYEILFTPLKGTAQLTMDNEVIELRQGELFFVDGAHEFSPKNISGEPFMMLVTLVN